MGILRRDHTIDDIDVDTCLANLDRLEGIGLVSVIDLRPPLPPIPDVVVLPTPGSSQRLTS